MGNFAKELHYRGLVTKVLGFPYRVSRGNTSSVLWLRRGQDVEMPIGEITIFEYRERNTDICPKR